MLSRLSNGQISKIVHQTRPISKLNAFEFPADLLTAVSVVMPTDELATILVSYAGWKTYARAVYRARAVAKGSSAGRTFAQGQASPCV